MQLMNLGIECWWVDWMAPSKLWYACMTRQEIRIYQTEHFNVWSEGLEGCDIRSRLGVIVEDRIIFKNIN